MVMTAESVDGTSNDAVGSTSNGVANRRRPDSTYAGGGDHPHGLLHLTEDQPGLPDVRRSKRKTTRAGKRPAAGEDERGRAGLPLVHRAVSATCGR